MTSGKLFSGYNMAIAHTNSQQLWLHSQDLSKDKPGKILTCGGYRSGEAGPKSPLY